MSVTPLTGVMARMLRDEVKRLGLPEYRDGVEGFYVVNRHTNVAVFRADWREGAEAEKDRINAKYPDDDQTDLLIVVIP